MKSLISNLKCHQNNTNFQHKGGLSYHNQAVDIKATPQISGNFASVIACCNTTWSDFFLYLPSRGLQELLGNIRWKKEHYCTPACAWPTSLPATVVRRKAAHFCYTNTFYRFYCNNRVLGYFYLFTNPSPLLQFTVSRAIKFRKIWFETILFQFLKEGDEGRITSKPGI